MSTHTEAPAVTRESTVNVLFTFSSPAEVFYNHSKNVQQVDLPTIIGNITILANDAPILGVLKPGVVSVLESDGNLKRFFVSSDSIAVHPDSSVQLLAEEAPAIENLDIKACEEALSDARHRLELAEDEKQKAEAQIEVDCAEAALQTSSALLSEIE